MPDDGAGAYTAVIGGRGRPMWLLPEQLMILGMAVQLPAIRVHTDGKYHPAWGDRIDGRRIRSASAMEQITAYFMVNCNGANNLFAESVGITELERYVRRKRRESLTGFGVTHVVMSAYTRTVARYPALNRFIAGQRIYSRGEDIALCMTVKKQMPRSAPDSLIKVHLHPGDTAADVYRKFRAKVEEAKDEMQNTNADNTAGAFMMIPGLVLKFAVWLLKAMDYCWTLRRKRSKLTFRDSTLNVYGHLYPAHRGGNDRKIGEFGGCSAKIVPRKKDPKNR